MKRVNVFEGTRVAPVGSQSRRKWNVLYISAAVYLSFLAFERIDFLQGQGSFVLSLELLGSLFFLACFFFDIITHRGTLLFSRNLVRYTELVTVFMITVLLSVPFSVDLQLSARRVLLLSIYAFGGLFSVNYLLTRRTDRMISMIVHSMVFLSIVYAVCSLYDVFIWFNPGMASRISALFPFYRSDIRSIGSAFIRVRGASGDPNRAGIFMIINTHLILQYCKRPALKLTTCIINVAVLALTLSRTAALCLALYVVLRMCASRKISRKNLFRTVIIMFLVLAILVGLYQVPLIQEAVGHTLERLQTRDGSANEHIRYIETGVQAAFSNLKILLIGNGYGVSTNILGGSGRYVNFHNAYVSFLVECGLPSMILFLFLLLYPLRKNKLQFPLVAVLLFANIPYQIYIEPYFWFLLPLICVMPQLQNVASAEGIHP